MKDLDRREGRMFVPVIRGMVRLGRKPGRVLDVGRKEQKRYVEQEEEEERQKWEE